MKIAVIGSRDLEINNIGEYIPEGTVEIVSGGACGVDACARIFAQKNKLRITEFLPEYKKYGRIAPIIRNRKIIEYSDCVIAFWNGKSRGTKYVIDECRKKGKRVDVFILNEDK